MIQSTDIPVVPIPDEIKNGGQAFQELKGLTFDEAITKIANDIVNFSFKLLIAILVFYIGRFIIRKLYKTTLRVMTNRRMDPSLTTFVLSLVKMTLYFILIITIIGILGIETSSFLAVFASAGVAIGMALSGTLQNFAGGVLILLLKPYKVGGYIEAQGYAGPVKSIQLFSTVINMVDNNSIIIPNGGLSTGSINNYSTESYRRVDVTVSLSYGTDYNAAKEAILRIVEADDRIVKKYVEDDMERRRHLAEDSAEEAEKAESGDIITGADAKKSWWQRIVPRFRKHRRRITDTITANEDLVVAIPVKLDRSPFVGLSQLADSSINIVVRVWTHSSNYWGVFFSLNEKIYSQLPEEGFSFPFPQLDVHVSKE